MAQVLRHIKQQPHTHPDLLVGLNLADDAAVYRLNDEQAIIQTVDFFTPIVDDPYIYGAIAAANAVSDIYAMGGEVLMALAIAAMPRDLPPEMIAAIFQGGADVLAEAGGVLAGGHTVADDEPKYGLCVTGVIHPARILAKGGAQPGDILVLTKPLGTGIVTTALKNNAALQDDIDAAVLTMRRLNRVAAQAIRSAQAHACTDITGFGLLGHAAEMAAASPARLRIRLEALPLLPGVYKYAAEGWLPGGADRNRQFLLGEESGSSKQIEITGNADPNLVAVCWDPQTSGGLFAAVPAENLPLLQAMCERNDQRCWVIGDVVEGSGLELIT